MPRPSLVTERREQILDAFEACILDVGVDGTSLETIAKQAGMKRSILRHYIGNRDDIIIALCHRYREHYTKLWQATVSLLPKTNRATALINMLFSPRNEEYIEQSIIGAELYSQARRLEPIRTLQILSINESMIFIKEELLSEFPRSDEEDILIVARSILSNYLQSEALLPLGLQKDVEDLKQVSLRVLQLLKE